MKTLIKSEEAAQFALAILLFTYLPYAWWWFPVLILVPDISMIGYLANPRWGAYLYNFAHHKGLAILVGIIGILLEQPTLMLAGIILFGHASMDRMFGYGLKYTDEFHHTHLGKIGIPKQAVQ